MNESAVSPQPPLEQETLKNESSLLQKARQLLERHPRAAKVFGGAVLTTAALFGTGAEAVQAQDNTVEESGEEQDSTKAILENVQEQANQGAKIIDLLESLQDQLSSDQTISISVVINGQSYTAEIGKRDDVSDRLNQMTEGQLDVSQKTMSGLLSLSMYGYSVSEVDLYIVNGDRNSPDYGKEYGRIIFSDSNRRGEIETPEDDFDEGESVITIRQKLEVGETYELKIKDEFTVPELGEKTVFRITGYNGEQRKYNVVQLDEENKEKPLTAAQQAFFDAMFPQGRGIQAVIEVTVPDPDQLPTAEPTRDATPPPTRPPTRRVTPTPTPEENATPDQTPEEESEESEGNSFTVDALQPFTLPGSDVELALNIRGIIGVWDDHIGGISRLEATWSPEQKAAVVAFTQNFTITNEGDGSFTVTANGGEGEAGEAGEETVTPTPRRQETPEVSNETVRVKERGTTTLKLNERFSFSGISTEFVVERSGATYHVFMFTKNGKTEVGMGSGTTIRFRQPRGLDEGAESAAYYELEASQLTVRGALGNEVVTIRTS